MSGFEIAGVVLGSIPLIISALEHYGNGLSTIQRWRRYQRELQSLVRNLQTEQVKLQNVIEKLLVGIASSSEIEALIDDPFGDLWRQETLETKIRFRLWSSSAVFTETVYDILKAIKEMKERIGPQGDGNVSRVRRGIFTLRRTRYEDLLSTIRTGVSNLENLTDRNIELEPSRRVRSQTKLFSVLRDMSNSLYRALRASFRCSCKHHVGLKLQPRSANITPMDDVDGIMRDLSFHLAISYRFMVHNETRNAKTALDWQEVVLKTECAPLPQPPAQSQIRNRGASPIGGKAKKSVAFFFSQTHKSVELHTKLPDLTVGVASNIAFSSAATILDLCGKLHQSQKQAAGNSYGTLIDYLPQTARRYSVHPGPTTDDSQSWSLVSLRKVLDQKTAFPPLSYHDRLRLAATISASVLQLHGTPWLPAILTSGDIFFIHKPAAPFLAMYWHPVLVRHLPEGDPQLANDQTAITTERNPTLLSLGCVLIEIILGRALYRVSTFPARETGEDLMSDYVAAQSLMEEVRMKSSNYGTAVARCVDGRLHKHGCGLEDGELCQDVYSGVVALLERDLENS